MDRVASACGVTDRPRMDVLPLFDLSAEAADVSLLSPPLAITEGLLLAGMEWRFLFFSRTPPPSPQLPPPRPMRFICRSDAALLGERFGRSGSD